MGESLILRRIGSKVTEGKYAWKKSGIILKEQSVTFTSGSKRLNWSGTISPKYISVDSDFQKEYFTDELFNNLVITDTNDSSFYIKLLPDKSVEYKISDYSGVKTVTGNAWGYEKVQSSGSTSYRLRINVSFALSEYSGLTFSGSGYALQPTFGFIGYVVDNDAAKYPDSGTQGEYTYEKIQS